MGSANASARTAPALAAAPAERRCRTPHRKSGSSLARLDTARALLSEVAVRLRGLCTWSEAGGLVRPGRLADGLLLALTAVPEA